MDDLQKLANEALELSEKATPGKWVEFPHGILSGAKWVVANGEFPFENMGDAEFIAFARTALPRLARAYLQQAEELAATRAENERLRAGLRELYQLHYLNMSKDAEPDICNRVLGLLGID